MSLIQVAGPCQGSSCPKVFVAEDGNLIVQGSKTSRSEIDIPEHETIVEIPREILLEAARNLV